MITLITAAVIIFADRIIKNFVDTALSLGETIPAIENTFHITLVYNNKSAFGLFNNEICMIVAVAASLFIIYLFFTLDYPIYRHPAIVKISLGMILGGALGNFWDRFRLGYVVDFIDFRFWPVFNIADMAVTVGMMLLVWQFFAKSA